MSDTEAKMYTTLVEGQTWEKQECPMHLELKSKRNPKGDREALYLRRTVENYYYNT